MDDVIYNLQSLAGGRVGWVFLAPSTVVQVIAICGRLIVLQEDTFMQGAV